MSGTHSLTMLFSLVRGIKVKVTDTQSGISVI